MTPGGLEPPISGSVDPRLIQLGHGADAFPSEISTKSKTRNMELNDELQEAWAKIKISRQRFSHRHLIINGFPKSVSRSKYCRTL